MPKTLTKSEAMQYLNGYLDAMADLTLRIELMFDEEEEPKPEPEEEPEVETSANSSKPKPRTGTNVPEPRNVPHAPEKPTKSTMPKVNPTHDKFVELFKEGKLPTEVAKALGVSPATAYNHLTKAKDKGEL